MILFYLIQAVKQSGDRNKIGIMEENKYLSTMMVAKRAKQLFAGAKPLIKTKSKKPVAITLEEVKEGKIFLKEPNNLKRGHSLEKILNLDYVELKRK